MATVTWCDKLASTPGVGVKLDKAYAPIASLLEPLTPIVSQWVDRERDKQAFTVDQQDLFQCTLTTYDGYRYAIGPEALSVEFAYRLRLMPQSKGPPIAELLSHGGPYTEVLAGVTARLLDLVRLVTGGQTRKLLRVGIVSTTVVGRDEAPPGIGRFLKRVAQPWDTSLDYFNMEFTTKLPKVKGTVDYDRCVHTFQRPELSDHELLTVKLDWQRYFDAGRALNLGALPNLIDNASKDALAYFENIGEGERFAD